MKIIFLSAPLFFISFTLIIAQTAGTVTGKLVDLNDNGLPGLQVQLFINPNVYNASSNLEGNFTFSNVTGVQEESLPAGYYVSNNYPNPFNPKTRIQITLASGGMIKVAVYNLLGQKVKDEIEKYFNAGNSYIDLELSGLANGFYIARLIIDEKYSIIRKIMLLYGSRHLTSSENIPAFRLSKANIEYSTVLATKIDSLVVTGANVFRKVFTNLPLITGATLSLGNLIIPRNCPGSPTVNYDGQIYNTVVIGNQCWLKENLNAGIIIQGNIASANNGAIEKYCYNNDVKNCAVYGGLYQWSEAMQYVTTPGAKGICPDGWHIPTKSELDILIAAVNSNANALKEIGQGTGNGAGTNTSGFSALLAGYRGNDSYFSYLGSYTRFWSSTELNAGFANFINLYFNSGSVGTGTEGDKETGYSIRCVKNQ